MPACCGHQNHHVLHALACFVLLASFPNRIIRLARLSRTTNTILVQKIENSTRHARL